MTKYIRKKTLFVLVALLSFSLYLYMSLLPAYSLEPSRPEVSSTSSTQSTQKSFSSENDRLVQKLLQSEDDIQYYAYLNLEESDASLHPVILEARNRIIFRQSWVADGLSGLIQDSEGNVINEVPQFSDLFPADWAPPIMSTDVDLSYYGR